MFQKLNFWNEIGTDLTSLFKVILRQGLQTQKKRVFCFFLWKVRSVRSFYVNGPSFFHHLSFFFLSLKCQDTEKACKKKKRVFCFFLWKVHSLRSFYVNEPSFVHHVLLFSHSNVKTVRQWLQVKKQQLERVFFWRCIFINVILLVTFIFSPIVFFFLLLKCQDGSSEVSTFCAPIERFGSNADKLWALLNFRFFHFCLLLLITVRYFLKSTKTIILKRLCFVHPFW